ncbi:hypothetical protein DM867_09780 [Halosegnis rubeus]|jgi:hypothetical protein|uniref:Uncharacterized protein n=1 Tax=Halosegnis rubeus TaxID=2212850 RepID=A0A5N5U441_9EURY|nr:hypothetical protein [Halosegnis rubeus]KAB7513265.1 hypothetical protein DM867_09780 [Halosegnis rubeus]KAB7517248.1 hypothetical protein DP108_09525 [Halosegnis rubeus]KAB7518520.1 hypothetical protein DMP03_03960 [Halosegnis rubeus]
MADFTFLRLDFGDVTVSTGGGAPEVTTSDADRDDSEESSSGAWLAALVGLLFLAVLAVLANRRRD